MLARVCTAAVVGLSAVPVTVEVDAAVGSARVNIVGLPDPAVRESKERIKSALQNSHYAWPRNRITVNLAPADVRKEGSAFDFPMALGLLAASGQLDPQLFADVVALGELALDGSLRSISGALPVALMLRGTGKRFLLPASNASEAAVVSSIPVHPVQNVRQAVSFLKGSEAIPALQLDPGEWIRSEIPEGLDFSDVKGQTVPKRAVEVAVIFGVDRFHTALAPLAQAQVI